VIGVEVHWISKNSIKIISSRALQVSAMAILELSYRQQSLEIIVWW